MGVLDRMESLRDHGENEENGDRLQYGVVAVYHLKSLKMSSSAWSMAFFRLLRITSYIIISIRLSYFLRFFFLSLIFSPCLR